MKKTILTITLFTLVILSILVITKNSQTATTIRRNDHQPQKQEIDSKVQVLDLTCEYKINPIGIDVKAPRLSWKISSDQNNIMQSAYEINVMDENGVSLWSTGKIFSDQSVNIAYNGVPLKSQQRAYWQVRIWDNNNDATKWSEKAYWEMGLLDSNEWLAKWISIPNEEKQKNRPCPFFRTNFNTSKEIKSARVYITSLGLYQLFINGEKISNDLFSPGWTSYNKRLQYQVYDVTNSIKKQNAVGAIVGDGWYRGKIGWLKPNNFYGDKLALLLQLEIDYADGTSQTIISDDNWKVRTGPILSSSIYNGEIYDARLENKDWTNYSFNDNNWRSVTIINHSKDVLIASQSDPVQGVQELKPIKLITTPKGETVLDMGQNMTGWLRMKVNGPKGDKVVLSFAEVLDKDGNFYRENLRSAKATDTYILSGDGEEIFEPHFTFHGFRFVKIEGYPGTPDLEDFTGVVIHSAMEPTGTFSCSNTLINQLQHNIQWGQKGNFLDIPTDCPQRDERLGWTGDAQVFCPTAAYNYNVAAFFTKWMKDLAADQRKDGLVPHAIPNVMPDSDGGSTAWADVAVIVPWTIYQVYNDKRILEEQYPSMKAWVDYIKNRAGDDYLWTEDNHFGDWLAFKSEQASDYTGATTEKDLIATAYYAYSANLLAKIAHVLRKEKDAKIYEEIVKNVKDAFISEYVTPNGRLVSHTQTAYCLALSFDLLPDNFRSKAAKYLADDVRKFKHLTTGFVGTPLLCKTLSDNGYSDLAFMLLERKDYPSWLYPVTQGATTIWERWDGQKPDGSFQSVGMNSFNHYAYGAIGEWMYSYIAGLNIDPSNPGYKHMILAPHIGGSLTNAEVNYESGYGTITSGWEINKDEFCYSVCIPANTTATVILPIEETEQMTVNSKSIYQVCSDVRTISNQTEITIGSGSYDFRCPTASLK